jgi:hypothetical protein
VSLASIGELHLAAEDVDATGKGLDAALLVALSIFPPARAELGELRADVVCCTHQMTAAATDVGGEWAMTTARLSRVVDMSVVTSARRRCGISAKKASPCRGPTIKRSSWTATTWESLSPALPRREGYSGIRLTIS